MLEAISLPCPAFLPYAAWSYGSPTPLKESGFSITSTTGTQQGGPCGSLVFAVTLQSVLLTAITASAAADDGIMTAVVEALGQYLSKLEPLAAANGLTLNPSKCRRWGPNLDSGAGALPPTYNDVPFMPWGSGLKVPGTPVGSSSFVREEVQVITGKLSSALDSMECLACPRLTQLPRSFEDHSSTPDPPVPGWR